MNNTTDIENKDFKELECILYVYYFKNFLPF